MLALIATVVTLAALFGLVSTRWLKLPIAVGTMLLTVLLSIVLALTSQLFPGVHAWAMHSVLRIDYGPFILHGLLSLLLFAGAFLLDLEHLLNEKLAVGFLAGLGTVLSTVLVGVGMHYGAVLVGFHPSWAQAFLFGALISPTDPIAVLEMLRRVAAPHYLQAQLAGESLFNDGVGAVIFLTVLGIAEGGKVPSIGEVSAQLLIEAGGGLLLGVALAMPVSRMMRAVNTYHVEILLTLSLALGGYAIADNLHLSAPLEAVAAGLALRWMNARHPAAISHVQIEHFWTAIDEVQNSVLFVLMGCEFLAVTFTRTSLLTGVFAIAVVNAARFAATAIVLGLIQRLQPGHRSSLLVLGWGGLRGGLSIALALSIPEALGRNWILTATYTVVIFSIVLKGGTMDLFLQRFRNSIAA
ncbi:MAG: cation:proton antiporter [Acidobacteriaceae bacterium]|nr:cation:proton antiporter [Acidobacteriaceae bacterium]